MGSGQRTLVSRAAGTGRSRMQLVAEDDAPLQDDRHPDLRRAYEALSAGDFATAADLLRPLAQAGNRVARHNMGVMYVTGQGARLGPNQPAKRGSGTPATPTSSAKRLPACGWPSSCSGVRSQMADVT